MNSMTPSIAGTEARGSAKDGGQELVEKERNRCARRPPGERFAESARKTVNEIKDDLASPHR